MEIPKHRLRANIGASTRLSTAEWRERLARWWFWYSAETVLGLLLVVLVLGLVFIGAAESGQYERDMAACQADGHKEWECRAWLRQRRRW